MLARLYVYDEQVIIPTVVQTEEGFYVDMQPISCSAVADIVAWKQQLYDRLITGNKIVPTPEPAAKGGSAILERLKLQKWTAFEKKAVMYTVHFGSSYKRLYRTGKGPDGMWSGSETNERLFDPRTPLQYIVDALVEDVIRQPEAHPVKIAGLLALRPN